MTIRLPDDLVIQVEAAVNSGRFASVDDAMAEATRLLLRELDRGPQAEPSEAETDPGPDLFLGSMSNVADELDEIVADAYRRRSEEAWRDVDVE
jgi:Arc/MetJ-type ribon-helix-helix transcriptional regulator